MDSSILRGWYFERQGLGRALKGKTAAEVLSLVGWARSVGGANPYLTMFARNGASREAVDEEVRQRLIQETPSARGCTYVVPDEDFELALSVAAQFEDLADAKAAKKYCGVTDDELENLSSAVLDALRAGPLDPQELRKETGALARSLGEEGKKRGVSSTLPLVLGSLQSKGMIRRVPSNGRLDTQKYAYELWEPHPKLLEPSAAFTDLARKYFRWIGPASLADFCWFTGLSQRAAKEAIEPLDLETINDCGDLMLMAEELRAFESYRPSTVPVYSLVSCIDSFFLLRRQVDPFVNDIDQEVIRQLGGFGKGLRDLEHHAILDRGRLIGFWQFDPEEGKIVWRTWVEAHDGLLQEIALTEEYIREQLGDARSFSLDSPDSRKALIDRLR